MLSTSRLKYLLATRALYPQGFDIMHAQRPEVAARQVHRDICSDRVLGKTADTARIERSLRYLANWQIAQDPYPRGSFLNVPADQMDEVISGEVPPLEKLSEARPLILGFLSAAMKGFEDSALEKLWADIPAFYFNAPGSDINIGDPEGIRGRRAVLGRLPGQRPLIFSPRSDNLSRFHFDVYGKNGVRLCGYAFQEGAKNCFAPYNYAGEEYRQFMLFNSHLFNGKKGFFDVLRDLALNTILFRAGLDRNFRPPVIRTHIMGPARRIELMLPNGFSLMMPQLNLESGIKYNVCVKKSRGIVGAEKTLFMGLTRADDPEDIRSLYLTIHVNRIGLFPIYTREIDNKGRIDFPKHLEHRPWEDLPSRLRF